MEHPVVDFALILMLGIGARWVAWRFRVPAILLLLMTGFAAGPVAGVLDPDSLFGDLLTPIVSFSVAIILYEGGLSLRISELREIGGVVRNLVSLGIVITWALGSAAAWLLLDLDWRLAVLLGAILVVSGPTVIVPLLRSVRPSARLASTLKWEGIFNDATGALLAVLVFEALLAGDAASATAQVVVSVLQIVLVSTLVGAAAALVLVVLLRYHWVPDFLDNAVSLALVLGAFAVSNLIQAESGLLAVTLMGVVLANQRWATVHHIIEFKENLRVLLISGLFVVLAARMEPEQLRELDANGLIFLLLLVLVVRPVAAAACTVGSRLSWGERVFLAIVAPRGIVAAAVAAVFALELGRAGYQEADRILSLTFLVITGTVLWCGLAARPLARLLGVAGPPPQGALIVGAHDWARRIAASLREQGVPVLLVDTNWGNVTQARMEGLPAHFGNAVSEETLEEIEMEGLGCLLALTPNEEANALASLHFRDVVGRKEVYQLAPPARESGDRGRSPAARLRGRYLFDETLAFSELSRLFSSGWGLRSTPLTEQFDYKAFQETHGPLAHPLFLVGEDGKLEVATAGAKLSPRPGQTLISLAAADPAPGS